MPESIVPQPLVHSNNDKLLWNSFKKGDQVALAILYERHFQKLYKHGIFTSRDHELVMDCLQELFSCLWSKRDRVSQVDCVKIYLFKSYHRLLINQLVGKRKWFVPLPRHGNFESIPPFEQTWIEGELKSEQILKLQDHIQSLSKGQREVIFLKFFNDLTYYEIAEIMEMKVDSVYNLVSKAIDLLRKKLQPCEFAGSSGLTHRSTRTSKGFF